MSTGSFKLRNTVYKNEHSSTLMGGMAINKSSQKSKCSNQFLARYFPALNSYVTLLAVKLCELIAFSRPHLNCEAWMLRSRPIHMTMSHSEKSYPQF